MKFVGGRVSFALSAWCIALFMLLYLGGVSTAEVAFSGAIVGEAEISVSTSSNQPVNIRIDSSAALPARAVIVVRGLPPTVKFSDGSRYGDGVWVMSPSALPRLQIQTASEPGAADLNVALVALDGTVLTNRTIALRVIAPTAQSSQSGAAPAVEGSAVPITKAERDAATKLLEMGNASFKSGNVAIAREYYKRAANKGLAEAALALGTTYDPNELQQFDHIVGVQADAALAKDWYVKARGLGSRDAAQKLKRFE